MSRGNFSSKIGFIAAAAGSAVGLGNIWKFPFEVGKGGGAAFVLMYLIFCFILCFPVMVTEIAIGRKTQKNPYGAYPILGFGKWRGLGLLGVFSGVLILSFYNVVAGWAFGYFYEIGIKGNFGIGNSFGDYVADWKTVGAFGIIFMGLTAFIVSRGVSGGIEKASKILMPVLISIILFLIIYSWTLPGSTEGIKFYLIPDFSKINLEVIHTALAHAFFSLSLGMGALITYGSYVSKKDNILSSAAFITVADVGIAFLAGLMMFPFVFSQGIDTNGGAGLIFMTLPGVFGSLGPLVGRLIGGLFFLLLSFAALTSTVSLLEVPVAYVVDELKIKRKSASWWVALVIFLVGIPSLLGNGAVRFFSSFITYGGKESPTDFMTFIADIALESFLPLGGLLTVLFVAFVWKKENLSEEIAIGNPNYKGSFLEKFLHFNILVTCPIILALLLILTVLSKFLGIHLV